MNQVEQMLKEIEENAQRHIAVVRGTIILEEDRPKYEAVLRLKDFLQANQSVFRELNTLATDAGVAVNSIVDSYSQSFEAPGLVPAVEAPRREEVPPVVVPAAAKAAAELVVEPAEVVNKSLIGEDLDKTAGKGVSGGSSLPDMDKAVPADRVPMDQQGDKRDEAALDAGKKLNFIPLSQIVNAERIELPLGDQVPTLPEIYRDLNTWVNDNIVVPAGYVCYARLNDKSNVGISADIYMGKLEGEYPNFENNPQAYEAFRRDLVLKNADYLFTDVASFEQKANVVTVDQFTLPLSYVNKVVDEKAPDVQEDVPAAVETNENQGPAVKLSECLDVDSIDLTLQFPENEVALSQALNSWVFEELNPRVPAGYVCYAKVNAEGNADVYMGSFQAADDEQEQKIYDEIRKDLLLYYDYPTTDVSLFEQKHGITRLEQCSKPLNIFKKTLSGTAPYVPGAAPASSEVPAADIDKVLGEEPAIQVQESAVADTNEPKIENLIKPELLNALPILSGTSNRYLSHDTLRRWIEKFIDLPEGYIMYATVTDINNATIYLGKKNQEETMELHALKSVPIELWEKRSNVTRIDSKPCVLVPQREGQELRKEDIVPGTVKEDVPETFVPPVLDDGLNKDLQIDGADKLPEDGFVPGDVFAGIIPPAAPVQFPDFSASLNGDKSGSNGVPPVVDSSALDSGVDPDIPIDASYSAVPEDEVQPTKVVGRRLTSWTSELSRSQAVRKGLAFLSKFTGKSETYTAYMNELNDVDLFDEDALIKLADIDTRLTREELFIKESEYTKIRNKLNKLVAIAQKNNGISRG